MINPSDKMIETLDIKNRILSGFGRQADEATKIIQEAISRYNYLSLDRIIRCIIYLSDGKLENFRTRINQAIEDPRDVMYWAEYVDFNKIPKHIRDFNKSFEHSETDVHE